MSKTNDNYLIGKLRDSSEWNRDLQEIFMAARKPYEINLDTISDTFSELHQKSVDTPFTPEDIAYFLTSKHSPINNYEGVGTQVREMMDVLMGCPEDSAHLDRTMTIAVDGKYLDEHGQEGADKILSTLSQELGKIGRVDSMKWMDYPDRHLVGQPFSRSEHSSKVVGSVAYRTDDIRRVQSAVQKAMGENPELASKTSFFLKRVVPGMKLHSYAVNPLDSFSSRADKIEEIERRNETLKAFEQPSSKRSYQFTGKVNGVDLGSLNPEESRRAFEQYYESKKPNYEQELKFVERTIRSQVIRERRRSSSAEAPSL